MQQENETGKVASSLMGQFIESGLVKQGEDGVFSLENSGGESKFKPFANE